MKKFVLGAAATALMMSTALAQAPAPAPQSTPAPAASSSTDNVAPSSSTAPASGSLNVVGSQKPDQFLASKFRGVDVIGSDNAKIGDVSDLLFDKSGKVEAFVVSVGGFLGVGSKDVAIDPAAFEVVKGSNNEPDKLKLTATKDQLKQAQNFEPYNAPRAATTTGSGTAGGIRPVTAPPTTSR